ncbi:amidohydrolase family protein [Allokutzneria sp. A3M-2-11 16]|uniref:amidohydrolase family protein n=1 Tax=Allokutzneria sp. A3M-2-11 16 TaxID=2962043 RepID=UPI0020B7414D|nr:amidohydrolase family protein [Allokutzneria sp. A3M-2-11 16]MCP3804429.1 amidohydrolase family protein [Allokutzneria sp. A3M-2-11 16]
MSFDLNRRDLLRSSGVVAAAAALGGATAVPANAAAEDERGGKPRVDLTEGTNISASASSDGKLIAFDLVTAIWVVGANGGPARRLTDDLADATLPHVAPDGSRIVFQSYRDGNYHLWTVRPDGSGLTQLTTGTYDHREPRFAPDGKSVVFTSDRGNTGSYGVFRLDLADKKITTLSDTAAEQAAPAWSPDGKRVAYTVDDAAIDVLDIGSGAVTRAVTATGGAKIYGPAFAPDGKTLSYMRLTGAVAELVVGEKAVTSGEDVFGFAATWLSADELLYTADGHLRRRKLSGGTAADIAFTASVPVTTRRVYRQFVRDITDRRAQATRGIASPVVSADGKQIAFRALNALWLLTIGDANPKRIVADGYFNSDPDFAPDGKSLVYTSDRAGDADLWVRDLASGSERRLTGLAGAQLTPRFSPDGKRIAYQDHDGAAWIVDTAGGTPKQVTPTLFMPGRITWSPDGNTIALAAVKPFSKRFREGTSQILTVDLASGALTYTEPMPFASIAARGDDGPVWSPDGKHLAFVVESTAWIVPVDARGKFTGAARQVTREVTDSLAWIGSDALLYLNNGRLRSQSIKGGRPATIPLDLTWKRPEVKEKAVIRAGALWDGQSRELRRNVDIIVDGNRIDGIVPSRPGRATVDASKLTVMPGLIDSHNHWHLRGRQWGDRQGRAWLAYGITTTRSPGDPVYQMLETREALDAGAQVGPRFFATGEAIDGSRVYYNFMRPTRSITQLDLELERARELQYDLIKTYVRLPVEYQKRVIDAAHRAGMPLSSHYLYPAEHIGMDGMEHTGATNRLGYSHTVSRLGRAYADAITLFVRSGMSITPTLFNSSVMYADDRSLVEDRRTRTLYPSWEYERLVKKADDAKLPAAEAVRALLKSNVDMVLRIHRGGGMVIAGTDAPLDNPAISLHTNLRAMVRYGFTPHEALTTATANTARWLGHQGRLGVVARGALADLSFVDGNPLADIRAAAAVRQVMLGGVLHTVEDLLKPFATPAARMAPAAVLRNPAVSHSHSDRTHWWHTPEWQQQVCCGTPH